MQNRKAVAYICSQLLYSGSGLERGRRDPWSRGQADARELVAYSDIHASFSTEKVANGAE